MVSQSDNKYDKNTSSLRGSLIPDGAKQALYKRSTRSGVTQPVRQREKARTAWRYQVIIAQRACIQCQLQRRNTEIVVRSDTGVSSAAILRRPYLSSSTLTDGTVRKTSLIRASTSGHTKEVTDTEPIAEG